MPERKSARASDFLFSISAFVIKEILGKNARITAEGQESVQWLHRSMQRLHTFLRERDIARNIAVENRDGRRRSA
nr:MAG TPA: hypothetical protein [Caudoviricetes sp.]